MDERYFSEIIEARVEQILRKSKEVLDEIDAFELPGGVVLTGGAASMPVLSIWRKRFLKPT